MTQIKDQKELYNRLNISRDVSEKDIQKAYRRMSKKYHPDMPEGNAEKFREIHVAYKVLSDPVKRKEYDETGQWNDQPDGLSEEYMQHQKTMSLLGSIFKELLKEHQLNIIKVDVMDELQGELDAKLVDYEGKISLLDEAIKPLNDIVQRITYSGDGPNVLAGIVAQDLEAIQKQKKQLQDIIKTVKDALGLLDDYEFRQDEEQLNTRFRGDLNWNIQGTSSSSTSGRWG